MALLNFWDVYGTTFWLSVFDRPTSYREGQVCNILDLSLCNNKYLASKTEYGEHLDVSDHIELLAYCDCDI